MNTFSTEFARSCLLNLSILAMIILVATSLGSCGGGTDAAAPTTTAAGPTTTDATATTTKTLIMPAGGTATSSDGKLKLVFPAGALAGENTITIKKLAPEDIPAEFDNLGLEVVSAYEFGPDGMTFDIPVSIQLDLDDASGIVAGVDTVPLVYLVSNGADTPFIIDGISQVANSATGVNTIAGTISHFSTMTIMIGGREAILELQVDFDGGVPSGLVVGDTFTVRTETLHPTDVIPLQNESGIAGMSSSPIELVSSMFVRTGKIVFTFRCAEVGTGNVSLAANYRFAEDAILSDLGVLFSAVILDINQKLDYTSPPINCAASGPVEPPTDDSGTVFGADWTRVSTIDVKNALGGDQATGVITGGGKIVTVTMEGPIPDNIHADGFDRANIELKFLRNGAPVTPGGLGTQKLDFFSSKDAWAECRHLSSRALFFTPDNGDTCSLSGNQITFVWDQPDNCFDRLEFFVRAVGGEGGSSEFNHDLVETCP